MMGLSEKALDFLAREGWGDAVQIPIPADFSTRRFVRLVRKLGVPTQAIVMIADPAQKTCEFVFVANLLRKLSISVPEIYAEDIKNDLVLMEDFGDANVGRMMDEGADMLPLYQGGVDVLIRLHQSFDPAMLEGGSLPVFDAELFAKQSLLFLDGYVPRVRGEKITQGERESFKALWCSMLRPLAALPQSFLLRDYMPDNLMSLPQRRSCYRMGVVDFQDAGFGPAPYDLASLMEHVRRDFPPEFTETMVDYYIERNPVISRIEMMRACRLLSAQRHIRILGNVAQRQNKLHMLPRIEAHMNDLFAYDEIKPLERWLKQNRLWA